MTPSPTVVTPETPLLDALDLMVQERFRHLPVVDDEGKLRGIVSDRDLKAALPDRTRSRSYFDQVARGTRIADIMTRDPLTIGARTPLVNAMAVMLSCRVGALPVLDQERLVGILTQSDVIRRYAEDLSRAQRDAPLPSTPSGPGEKLDPGSLLIFLASPDHRMRDMLAAPLSDAGFQVQSFDSIPELMTVWHLVLPDLLVIDETFDNHPNQHILLRNGTPLVKVHREGGTRRLVAEGGATLELPAPEAQLQRLFARLMMGSARPIPKAASQPAERTVLVAEDDHVIRRILGHHLGRHGFKMVEAQDGREAAALLAERSYDLLILDINMPFFSGLDILRQLRRAGHPSKRIILSSSHRDETVMEAFQLGADDFVKKPFNPEVLVRRIDRLLERS
jgi:CheY-like chemotaxis protein/CBS domain-containing protein